MPFPPLAPAISVSGAPAWSLFAPAIASPEPASGDERRKPPRTRSVGYVTDSVVLIPIVEVEADGPRSTGFPCPSQIESAIIPTTCSVRGSPGERWGRDSRDRHALPSEPHHPLRLRDASSPTASLREETIARSPTVVAVTATKVSSRRGRRLSDFESPASPTTGARRLDLRTL